jgi:hypothetical protein
MTTGDFGNGDFSFEHGDAREHRVVTLTVEDALLKVLDVEVISAGGDFVRAEGTIG